MKLSWAVAIGILALVGTGGAPHAEEKCFAGATAGSQFCIQIDYYSCIVSAIRGHTCPNGCSGEERDNFYITEEDKCAKQFSRPDGQKCMESHGFEADPDCESMNPDDPSQCPGKEINVSMCWYGSYDSCMEASTRTWQFCKGSPDDCEKFSFDENQFCGSLSGRPGPKRERRNFPKLPN